MHAFILSMATTYAPSTNICLLWQLHNYSAIATCSVSEHRHHSCLITPYWMPNDNGHSRCSPWPPISAWNVLVPGTEVPENSLTTYPPLLPACILHPLYSCSFLFSDLCTFLDESTPPPFTFKIFIPRPIIFHWTQSAPFQHYFTTLSVTLFTHVHHLCPRYLPRYYRPTTLHHVTLLWQSTTPTCSCKSFPQSSHTPSPFSPSFPPSPPPSISTTLSPSSSGLQ